MWSLDSGAVVKPPKSGPESRGADPVTITRDGVTLYSVEAPSTPWVLVARSVETGALLWKHAFDPSDHIFSLALDPDERRLVVGTSTGRSFIVDLELAAGS